MTGVISASAAAEMAVVAEMAVAGVVISAVVLNRVSWHSARFGP